MHTKTETEYREAMRRQEQKNETIRQQSRYNDADKADPDNNPFFEMRSNPLSSKGN